MAPGQAAGWVRNDRDAGEPCARLGTTRKRSWRRRLGRTVVVVALAFLLPGRIPAASAQERTAPGGPVRFQVVFSSSMFTDVNETDAKASVKAWAETFARERHIQAVPDPQVIEGLPALARALRTMDLGLVSLTTEEYLNLQLGEGRVTLLTAIANGQSSTEYVLLVHRETDIQNLAALKGRKLILQEDPRASLALPWLDTILLEAGLPPTNEHFGQVTRVKKLSGVVLPVFFRQADACLVTRAGLETLSELNPQVGGQMRILATSPGLLPSLACIPAAANGAKVALDLMNEVVHFQDTTPGRQLLNLFQSDRIIPVQPGEVDRARQLLATHRQLLDQWNSRTARSGATAARKPAKTPKTGAASLLGGSRP